MWSSVIDPERAQPSVLPDARVHLQRKRGTPLFFSLLSPKMGQKNNGHEASDDADHGSNPHLL